MRHERHLRLFLYLVLSNDCTNSQFILGRGIALEGHTRWSIRYVDIDNRLEACFNGGSIGAHTYQYIEPAT